MENLYSCADIAKRYGVTVETVWKWIRNKKLTALSVGKTYKIPESAVKDFDERNKTTST